MNRLTRTAPMSCLAALGLAAALAGPIAASTHDYFDVNDVAEHEYSCGVLERTAITGRGTSSFAGDGTWIGTSIHLEYAGTLTDPASGRVIHQSARQNLKEAPGQLTTSGQGIFLRLAGEGVVLHDVGRLVFDLGDGSTQFATPKVLRFDDPDIDAKTDAAVCGMFD